MFRHDICTKYFMSKRMTQEEAIEQFVSVHGNKYDYSKVQYNGMTKHITAICPTHGEFSIRAAHHKSGYGCAKCTYDSMRMWNEDSIRKEALKYDSKTEFSNSSSGAYTVMLKKHGHLIDDICLHMERPSGKTRLEDLFWDTYLSKKLKDYDVVRDKKLKGTDYRPDFLIESEKTIVEFDEKHHRIKSHKDKDARRQKELETLGYTVTRISEEDFLAWYNKQ